MLINVHVHLSSLFFNAFTLHAPTTWSGNLFQSCTNLRRTKCFIQQFTPTFFLYNLKQFSLVTVHNAGGEKLSTVYFVDTVNYLVSFGDVPCTNKDNQQYCTGYWVLTTYRRRLEQCARVTVRPALLLLSVLPYRPRLPATRCQSRTTNRWWLRRISAHVSQTTNQLII